MFILSTEILIGILLFISVFLIVQYALSRMLRENKISTLIALVVALISVTYISWDQVQFLNESYGYGVLILLMSIPLISLFFFLYTSDIGPLARKMIWIIYGVIMISVLNGNETLSSTTTTTLVFIFGGVLLLIILFDKGLKNKINIIKNMRRGKKP